MFEFPAFKFKYSKSNWKPDLDFLNAKLRSFNNMLETIISIINFGNVNHS